MATNTGKYDPNIDYAAAIAKATSPEQAKVLEAQRNFKIADMNEMGTNKGYTETYTYNKPTLSEPVIEVPDYYSKQEDLLSKQYALQEKSRIDALKAAQANALSALSREETTINPAYRKGMSNISSTANLQARNLAEYLAQRGQTSSGISAQSRLNIQGNAMSQQSALEQQRASAIADIEQRRTDTQSAYDAGAVQAATERSISETQGLIDLANQERETGIATVGQYYDDYAAQINAIKALEAKGDYSQSYLLPYLTIARNEKIAALEKAKADADQQEYQNWLSAQKINGTTDDNGTMTEDEAFALDFDDALNGYINPKDIETNRVAIMSQYGVSKYNQLLEAANENYTLTNEMISQGFGTTWKGRWY